MKKNLILIATLFLCGTNINNINAAFTPWNGISKTNTGGAYHPDKQVQSTTPNSTYIDKNNQLSEMFKTAIADPIIQSRMSENERLQKQLLEKSTQSSDAKTIEDFRTYFANNLDCNNNKLSEAIKAIDALKNNTSSTKISIVKNLQLL